MSEEDLVKIIYKHITYYSTCDSETRYNYLCSKEFMMIDKRFEDCGIVKLPTVKPHIDIREYCEYFKSKASFEDTSTIEFDKFELLEKVFIKAITAEPVEYTEKTLYEIGVLANYLVCCDFVLIKCFNSILSKKKLNSKYYALNLLYLINCEQRNLLLKEVECAFNSDSSKCTKFNRIKIDYIQYNIPVDILLNYLGYKSVTRKLPDFIEDNDTFSVGILEKICCGEKITDSIEDIVYTFNHAWKYDCVYVLNYIQLNCANSNNKFAKYINYMLSLIV